MRSSPWFLSADEVDGVLAIPARGSRVALDRLRRQSRISSMGPKTESTKHNHFGYPRDNPFGFCDGHVAGRVDSRDAHGEGSFRLSHRRNSAFLDGHVKSTQSEMCLRQHDFQSVEKKDNSKAVPHTESSWTPFGRLPRIIRKVASMRSDSHRTQESADAPKGSNVTFQRSVPRVRSFRSILPGPQVPGTYFKQGPRQSNKRNFFWTGQASKPKTEMDTGRDKQRRQSTSHMVYENNLPGKSSTALFPFKNGTSWKEDLNKSFIDISPDRNVQPKGRGKERIKLLLSKANELFSWGRSQKNRLYRKEGDSVTFVRRSQEE
jgi:prepilin-type processing-associated H-X9-DG protein